MVFSKLNKRSPYASKQLTEIKVAYTKEVFSKLNKRSPSASKQLTETKVAYTKGFLKIKQEISFCLKTINRH